MSYQGKTIDPKEFLQQFEHLAEKESFRCERLLNVSEWPVSVFQRDSELIDASPRIYLSAGVHGDEPAAPLALMGLMKKKRFSRDYNWTLLPMLNPGGFAANRRDNREGIDLNRDYRNPQSPEVQAHIRFLEAQSGGWDLALLLHEDWESLGFYLYEIHKPGSHALARKIIEAVSEVCPVDVQESIDGMPANHGIISPNLEEGVKDPKLKDAWPEAFYLHFNELSRYQYTLEAPSALEMETRIAALEAAILAAVRQF